MHIGEAPESQQLPTSPNASQPLSASYIVFALHENARSRLESAFYVSRTLFCPKRDVMVPCLL